MGKNRVVVGRECRSERLEGRLLLSAVGPTAVEQYVLQLINAARENPAATAASLGIDLNEGLSPGTISPDPKQPLAFNLQLVSAARSHNTWMIQSGTFAHNEGASDPGAQMRAAGYPFAGSWAWGQNIAWSGQAPQVPAQGTTAAQEERELFADTTEPGRGHRLNLLDGSYKEIGVGVSSGLFQGYNAVLATQDFASESGGSFLVGVAYADANHTHSYQIGEGLGGVTITATRQTDGASFTTTTWTAGGYTLPLAPGTYTLTASGGGIGSVSGQTVSIGAQNIEMDFTPGMPNPVPAPTGGGSGHRPAPRPRPQFGRVTGTIFRDRNGNGVRDPGEAGVAAFRVFADLNGDGIWQRDEPSAFTNSRGGFRLKLSPGDYTLRVASRPWFQQTSPAGGTFAVSVAASQTTAAVQFGEYPIPKPARVHARRRRAKHRSTNATALTAG